MDYGFLNLEKILVVSLSPGEDVLESIEKIIHKEKIVNASVLSGFGTLDRVHLHWVTTTDFPPTEHFEKFDGPFELLSITGIIANSEAHLHAVVSDLKGAYGGHLEKGNRVLYLCEIALSVLSGKQLIREALPEGIKQLRIR